MAASKEGMMNIWDVYKKSEDTTNEVVYEPISEEKVENFNMYVDTCLVHMIPRTIWNKYHMNKSLTDLFTIADEAFAMLILENIFQWLTFVAVFFQVTMARPSEKLKIVFNNDKVSSLSDNHCDLDEGE